MYKARYHVPIACAVLLVLKFAWAGQLFTGPYGTHFNTAEYHPVWMTCIFFVAAVLYRLQSGQYRVNPIASTVSVFWIVLYPVQIGHENFPDEGLLSSFAWSYVFVLAVVSVPIVLPALAVKVCVFFERFAKDRSLRLAARFYFVWFGTCALCLTLKFATSGLLFKGTYEIEGQWGSYFLPSHLCLVIMFMIVAVVGSLAEKLRLQEPVQKLVQEASYIIAMGWLLLTTITIHSGPTYLPAHPVLQFALSWVETLASSSMALAGVAVLVIPFWIGSRGIAAFHLAREIRGEGSGPFAADVLLAFLYGQKRKDNFADCLGEVHARYIRRHRFNAPSARRDYWILTLSQAEHLLLEDAKAHLAASIRGWPRRVLGR